MPDEITRITERFRREMRRAEGRAARQLVEAYNLIWRQIRSDLAAVTQRIAEARQRGETVNAGWLAQNVRLDALDQQIDVLMAGLESTVERRVIAAQAEAVAIRQASAEAVMGIVRPSNFVFPAQAVAELVGVLVDGSPVARVIALRELQTGSAIRNTLIKGVSLGWNPRKMEREARKTVGRVLSKVLRIHRTEAHRAFREAGYVNRNANPDVYRGWVWLSAADTRTCASCWAMHGTIHRVNERLDDHPNGRCVERDLIKGFENPDIKLGDELFKNLSPVDQRKILSPAKYEAFREGKITLGDLTTRKRSRVWGTTRREASLAQALQSN